MVARYLLIAAGMLMSAVPASGLVSMVPEPVCADAMPGTDPAADNKAGVEDVIVGPHIEHRAIDVWPSPSLGELNVDYIVGPTPSEPVARLYDVQGRSVARLRRGANDLSRIAAGTYFVRADGIEGVAKVILR